MKGGGGIRDSRQDCTSTVKKAAALREARRRRLLVLEREAFATEDTQRIQVQPVCEWLLDRAPVAPSGTS